MKAVKNIKIKWEKPEAGKVALACSFLFPVAVMLLLFIINGIYPFGDRSFLSADLYHQYMPFFSEFLRKLRGGENLFFSCQVGIGSNFLALFVYYLASPLHFLALLVPESHLIEFIGYLIVVKTGLCGLTACIYLRKHFETTEWGTVLFSCFYAFSGFMAAYNYNIMWVDCVILLPLILLGLERLVKEGRFGLYCVTLALSIYTNFYLSIMICIFLVLYFIYLFACNGKRGRSILYFTVFSLLAGGMAAVLLVPEVCALLQTDFGDMNFPTKLESYFPVIDVLARHLVCVFTERGLDHWPNIYCGSAVLMLIPMYMMNRKISVREKLCKLLLTGFLLLSFSTNYLDFIWHGFNYPDSLPGRQSFLYCFLILIMAYEAYFKMREEEPAQIVYSVMLAGVFILYCEKYIDTDDFEPGVKLLTLGFVVLYGAFLYLVRTREGKDIRRGVAIVATAAVLAECSINTWDTSIANTSRSAYLAGQEDYRALYDLTKEREDGLYRLEKFSRRTKNDGTLAGYPTASVFSSTMNSYVMDMYRELGMRHSKVFYSFDGATALTSALLNVKYMFADSADYENSLYSLVTGSGDIYLYACEETLPFGYVLPYEMDLPSASNGIRVQNTLVKRVGVEGILFQDADAKKEKGDVKFSAEEGGIYYGLITSGGIGKVTYIGGSTVEETFTDIKNGSILYLGYLEKGQNITLTNGDEDSDAEIHAEIFRLDEDVLREVMEKLSRQHLEVTKLESDKIGGTITMEERGRLVLSIPAEKGWRVTVNGEKTEPQTFGGCLMAFDLEPGTYEIQMKYIPQGLIPGVIISVLCIAAFAGILAGRRKKRT